MAALETERERASIAERERALEMGVVLAMEGRIGFVAQVAALVPATLPPLAAPPEEQR